MLLLISRRYFQAALAMVGIVSLGVLSVAIHPHLQQWKQEGIVISSVNTREKVVALTFDDGPQPQVTPALVTMLNEHQAKATFFVLGYQAERYPQIVRQAFYAGNEIGNHGYSHQISRYRNLKYAITDIEMGSQVIKSITGRPPALLRPPGGFLSDDMVDYCRKANLQIVTWTWDQDTKDWRKISGRHIARHILDNLQPGQIIILHDGGTNRQEMLKAVEIILTELPDHGYRAVTVSQLISLGK